MLVSKRASTALHSTHKIPFAQMGNDMVGPKGFLLRGLRQMVTNKNNMTHRFEVFRAPIDLAFPVPSYIAAPPALPR